MALDNVYNEENEEEVAEELIFLKCRFTIDEKNLYGILYILFNVSRRDYEKVDIIVSRYKDYIEKSITIKLWQTYSWLDLEQFITTAKLNGQYTDIKTKDIRNSIETVLKSADINILLAKTKRNDIMVLEQEFTSIFARAVGKCSPIFDFAFEYTTFKEMDELRVSKQELYDKQQKITDKLLNFEKVKQQVVPSDAAIINILFVLAPVSGIPIERLSTGDQVMVRVDINDQKASYFGDLLGFVKNEEAKAIPVMVEKVEKNPAGGFFIIVKIQDGVYGQIIEDDPVKVQLAASDKDNIIDKPIVLEKDYNGEHNSAITTMTREDKIQLIILLFAFTLIITIIVYIFSMFY